MGRSRNRVKIGPAPQHWYLGICTSTGTYKILLIDLSYRRFTRRSLNTNRYLKMLCIALPVLHLKGQCHAIFCPLIFLFKTLPVRWPLIKAKSESTSTYKILLIYLSYRRFTRRSLNTNRYQKMLCIALPVLHLKGQCHAILTPHFFVQNATGARYLEPLQKLEVKNFAKQWSFFTQK